MSKNIQWSFEQLGCRVIFEMHLGMAVGYWWDTCQLWVFLYFDNRLNCWQIILQVPDPGDRDERTANESLEFAHFKRVVYQKVASRVFSSLRRRSHSGEARQCGDAVNRVLHPGILIESHDGEEANIFCACRASGRANYPCPKCLVHKDQLNNIIGNFEARTSDSMRSVIRRTLQASTKTEKENILQGFGLHDIQV